MAKISMLLLSCLLLLSECGTAAKSNEDPRLDVQAAMASRQPGATTAVLFIVRIRNVSEQTLLIRRVETDPIGGGQIRTAYAAPSKAIEPGEEMDLEIWAELDPKETVMGIGEALARIVVAFDDGAERILGSYLIRLK